MKSEKYGNILGHIILATCVGSFLIIATSIAVKSVKWAFGF